MLLHLKCPVGLCFLSDVKCILQQIEVTLTCALSICLH